MSVNPTVSLQTLSAADGFLAGLIYLSVTKQAIAQNRAPGLFTPAFQSWRYLEGIWFNLQSVQNGMLEIVPGLGLQGIDYTLDSFVSPVLFFQTAVLSLRNTLIGRTPSTVGDIVALFCLSHVVFLHLRRSHDSVISGTELDIDQWGNAISRYDHRQAFASLIRALFPEITTALMPPNFVDPVTAEYHDAPYFMAMCQDAPFEPPSQEAIRIGDALQYSDATPNLFSLSSSRPRDQAAQNDRYIVIGETQLTGLRTDPHGPALVANFTLFLEQCGDLFQNLSGRWVTAKHQYSPLSVLNRARRQSNDVSSYLQRMLQEGSFQDPFSMGILSIVDTFVQLGYLRTPKDVQEYMIIVGKSATVQDISLFGDFADPFWGGLLDVPGSLLAPNFQMPDATPGAHPTVLDNLEPQLSTGDLRQSAVINILTSFIANCGDLMDILSGHGVTTKGPHSDVSLEVKNFTQALRRHESFGGPSARGILAIVDRFVGLDYYQSIDEIRDYIAIVAKEILPSGKPFAEVCKSVYSSVHTDMAKIPPVGRRQHAERPLDRKLWNPNTAVGAFMGDNNTYRDAISAVSGLLACLIYLETDPQMADPFVHDLCHHVDRYWERLGEISSSQTTPNLTALLKSFESSAQFYELAIFTFRNVLVGAEPDSLSAIFSLCSLSYIASCCLRNYDNFRDIEVWQNAIRDPQERGVFINLAGVVWPRVSLTPIDDALNSQMSTVIEPGSSTHQNATTQSLALEFDFLQDEWLFDGLFNAVCEPDVMPDSSVAIDVENLHRTPSTLEDLQESAIVSNLVYFLTECGDLLHVFSGRGVTAKDLYSCVAFTQGRSEAKNVVNACVQRLKNDYTCQNASTGGIMSIVERFVALGYLQTPEELRKYMLCVGRAVIPEDETLAEFCQTVRETTATVSGSLTPPRGGGRGRRLRELRLIPRRVIPCEMLYTQVALLAAATLVAGNAAPQPKITQRAVLPRDIIPDDIKSWAESKASAAGQDVDDWVKSHYSEAEQWASDKGGDAKTWAEGQASDARDKGSEIASRASTAFDGISSKVRTAVDEASASASAATNNDNAAATVGGGQAGVVAFLAAVGAAVFAFMA
ncbi:unnamed protein product [Fusarium fujikuroi]|nr:unnamed protein product [Fusarium fujikuroi]